MEELQELLKRIEELRDYLEELIEKKNGVWDPEVIAASKMLDAVLNEYDRVLKGK